MWEFSSRNQIHAPSIGSAESLPPLPGGPTKDCKEQLCRVVFIDYVPNGFCDCFCHYVLLLCVCCSYVKVMKSGQHLCISELEDEKTEQSQKEVCRCH